MEQEHALTAEPQRFDYGSLDTRTAASLRERAGRIHARRRRMAQDIVDVGRELIAAKEEAGHGHFGAWLGGEFSWSTDTAQRFMRAARDFGDKPQIAVFEPSAMYLLSAPSTPAAAKEEALERAAGGETITHATARQIVADHRGEEGAVCGIPQTADHTPVDAPVEAEEEPPGLTPKQEYQRRYPHSTALVGWLNHVGGQTFHIEADLGGLGALLAEPGKWDRQETVNFILPQLDALGRVIATYRREIGHVFE